MANRVVYVQEVINYIRQCLNESQTLDSGLAGK